MDCKQARELLIAAAERDPARRPPTQHETDNLSAHLMGCAECRRFAAGARGWRGGVRSGKDSLGFAAGRASHAPADATPPDLTERVLASVRPLPPPWVYEQTQREKRTPHLVAIAVGAVGATLTFLMVSLALVVAVAGDGATLARGSGLASQAAMEMAVNAQVRGWFGSLATDTARLAVTVAMLALVLWLLLRWLRAFATRAGHDDM